MSVKVRWLTNSTFEISYKGLVITTDPTVRFMTYEGLGLEDYSRPDYVLVTHLHWDHIGDSRFVYSAFKPLFITGAQGRAEFVDYLGADAAHILPVYPQTELDFGTFKVKALYGVHLDFKKSLKEQIESTRIPSFKFDDDLFDLQKTGSLEFFNYLITLDDGYRILMCGGQSSDYIWNMMKDLKPDLALIQCSLSRLDDLKGMIECIKPSVVVPYHHDFSKTEDVWKPALEKFKSDCACEFVIMENNQTVEF